MITKFEYNEDNDYAEAKLKSIFRFPKSAEIYFQCDVAICKGDCSKDYDCSKKISATERLSKSSSEEGSLMASTSTFVLDPNQASRKICNFSF